jgi:predicted kinase
VTLRLVVVSGPTAAGKSTMADAIGGALDATVASFDWLMSGLRAFPDLWSVVELPVEKQRAIGWSLLSRVAEQNLRRGKPVVLDLVAREEPRRAWERLATDYGARFGLVECVCSDAPLTQARLTTRRRAIPDWYELTQDDVERSRHAYVPLSEPKIVVDAVDPVAANLERVRAYLDL